MTESLVDDTAPLHCSIENSYTDSHVVYIIRVRRGLIKTSESWTIKRRYSDFDTLNLALHPSGIDLPLPPKKVFGNKERMFVIERQRQLEAYLRSVLQEPVLACQFAVKQFLDPDNYSFNFSEEALQHVSMFFRSEVNWEVVEPLPHIGWRIRKEFFMIRPKDTPKGSKHVLSYIQPGQPLLLSEKDLSAALRLLPTIQHPFIAPTIYASYNGIGAVIVRPLFPEGSLRDVIYKVKPTVMFMKKYSSRKTKGLSLLEIRQFGRQILEGLKFLSERSMLYDHIHSGNILVDKGVCRLSDTETAFLCLPSFYRTSLSEFRKIQTKEDAVVYAFGRILYEMGCGCMMKTGAMEMVSSACHPEVCALLESLLSVSALKSGLPSIDELISNPLFPELQPPSEKPQLKVSSKLKEALKQVRETEEADMQERARKVHLAKKADKGKHRQSLKEEKTKRIRQQWKAEKAKSRESKPKIQTAPPAAPLQSTPAPPPAPPPVPPPAPPTQAASSPAPQRQAASGEGRGALLSSIAGFKKGGLKKTQTNDRSTLKV